VAEKATIKSSTAIPHAITAIKNYSFFNSPARFFSNLVGILHFIFIPTRSKKDLAGICGSFLLHYKFCN
jgi:hypothetical protein